MNARARLAALSLLVLAPIAACKTYGSLDRSKGYTGDPTKVDVDDVPVRGHEIEVDHADKTTSGELLAIDDTYLYVLTSGHVQAIERRTVKEVSIELYPSQATAAGVWTALGTVSTISHGFFLIISAPAWIATGVPATVAAANSNDLTVRDDKLGPLYQFARFPQGLPPTWPGARPASAPPAHRRVADAGPPDAADTSDAPDATAD